jgi:hypothetical protein
MNNAPCHGTPVSPLMREHITHGYAPTSVCSVCALCVLSVCTATPPPLRADPATPIRPCSFPPSAPLDADVPRCACVLRVSVVRVVCVGGCAPGHVLLLC